MAFLDVVLNPVLNPLINFNPFWGIIAISFAISLLITLVYKLVTDQNEMKRLKGEQKEFQQKMKEARSNPEQMKVIQKDAMKVNINYMKQSFKPTLYTMIPIILIFSWMAAHLAFEPIYPGEQFSITASFKEGVSGVAELVGDSGVELINDAKQDITGAVTWNLRSSFGEHFLTVKTDNDEQTKKVLITEDLQYEEPISQYKHSDISQIQVNYKELKPVGDFSIFGWQPGWLGLYIIFSIIFSMALRKVLKVY